MRISEYPTPDLFLLVAGGRNLQNKTVYVNVIQSLQKKRITDN